MIESRNLCASCQVLLIYHFVSGAIVHNHGGIMCVCRLVSNLHVLNNSHGVYGMDKKSMHMKHNSVCNLQFITKENRIPIK